MLNSGVIGIWVECAGTGRACKCCCAKSNCALTAQKCTTSNRAERASGDCGRIAVTYVADALYNRVDGRCRGILARSMWLDQRGERDRARISSRIDTTRGQPGELQDALDRAMGMVALVMGVEQFGCLV
jgi:hypothetical protein